MIHQVNRFLKLRLWQRRRMVRPVIEFGDRIAELNPDLLEPPSNHGDWRRISRWLWAVYAGYAAGFIVIALLIGTVIYIYGCPPKARGAELLIETGPGQDGATLVMAGVSSFSLALSWLRLDSYAAVAERDRWHGMVGLDLTIEAASDGPHAAISFGRAYWFDPTARVDGHGQWHAAARVIVWSWTAGLHHWSNGGGTLGPGDRDNLGENFITFGWRF